MFPFPFRPLKAQLLHRQVVEEPTSFSEFLFSEGALYFGLRFVSYFDISNFIIQVSGPVDEPTNEVLRIVQPCKGKNLFEISSLNLKSKIKSCFGVEDVRIKRFYPDKLIIMVDYCDYLAKLECNENFYFAGESSLFSTEKQTFDTFKGVRKIEIDSDYCAFLSKWGYDEGFFRAVSLVSNLKSNLITCVKYDNNNGNEFGRLIISLDVLGVELYVCEAVSSERVDQAIDLLREEISIPESGIRYDLYGDSLIKRS